MIRPTFLVSGLPADSRAARFVDAGLGSNRVVPARARVSGPRSAWGQDASPGSVSAKRRTAFATASATRVSKAPGMM